MRFPTLTLFLVVLCWSAQGQTDSGFVAHNYFAHPFRYASSDFNNNKCDMYRVDVRKEADSLRFSFITAQQDTLFVCPIQGDKTSSFGPRNLYTSRFHYGTDLDLHTGDTIYAAFDGVVRVSKYDNGGYGNVIVIAHKDGLETLYAHLSKRHLVKGQRIAAGEVIGLGGNTGRSTGAHLHFEMRFLGEQFNPELLVDFKRFKLKMPEFTIKRQHFKHLDMAEGDVIAIPEVPKPAFQHGVGGGRPRADHKCGHHHKHSCQHD